MTLLAGTRLGPYEIQAPLGAGGMGEVYRAHDSRLERTVAIKVLPAHLSSNADMKLRFEREAKAISALQHPHICTLFDVGSQDGVDFLVMECLEGETLAERLRKGALPLPDLLRIGCELADALEKAHRGGIVHRDLKPGNIMLTKSGVKLMDFGLAKPAATTAAAAGPAPLLSAAMTMTSPNPQLSPLTSAGTLVGTMQYMSPEQLQGIEADARSDIFGLGAVLYEMATGERAFQGKSQLSVATAILEKDPEPLPPSPTRPPALEGLIRACLAKDPAERVQDVHDVRLQLEFLKTAAPTARAPTGDTIRWRSLAAAFGTLSLLLLLTGAAMLLRPHPAAQVLRAQLEGANPNLTTSVSPDGRRVVVSVGRGREEQRLLLDLATGERRPLNLPRDATYCFWSPDARRLGCVAPQGRIVVLDMETGASSVVLASGPGLPRGAAWSQRGTIIYGQSRGPLMELPAGGGESRPITKLGAAERRDDVSHRFPLILPDGRNVLYLATRTGTPDAGNAVLITDLVTGETHAVTAADAAPLYAEPFLLYIRGEALLAQRFNTRTLALEGDARVLLPTRPATSTNTQLGASASPTVLTYTPGSAHQQSTLTWFDGAGKELGTLLSDSASGFPFLSRDDRHLAFYTDAPEAEAGIWIMDLARGAKTRLTRYANDFSPVLSPDNEWAYFNRLNKGLMRIRTDGRGAEELISEEAYTPLDVSADGRVLLAFGPHPAYFDLGASKPEPHALPIEAASRPRDLQLSPDGRRLAYVVYDSGVFQTFMCDFPSGANRIQLTTEGGVSPRWSADGKFVYFMSGTNEGESFYKVLVNFARGVEVGRPQKLFTIAGGQTVFGMPFVVARDGRLLVALAPRNTAPVSIIHNWQELLRDR